MENNYFELRKVSPERYQNSKIPNYINCRLKGNEVILDFGCGFGQLISALMKEGFANVYGLDINEEALNYCKSQNMMIFKSIEEIDFKFDVIIMSHVLEHIEKDKVIETLKTIRERLLKKGGSLYVMVPNAQSNTGCYWRYEDWTHKTLFTSGSLFYVVKAAGFSDIKFLDIDNTEQHKIIKRLIKKLFLKIYRMKIDFWNKVTSSAYHAESPNIYSYEIKIVASN